MKSLFTKQKKSIRQNQRAIARDLVPGERYTIASGVKHIDRSGGERVYFTLKYKTLVCDTTDSGKFKTLNKDEPPLRKGYKIADRIYYTVGNLDIILFKGDIDIIKDL